MFIPSRWFVTISESGLDSAPEEEEMCCAVTSVLLGGILTGKHVHFTTLRSPLWART
jgi:hypothetical protein